jgi:hypothetical protein
MASVFLERRRRARADLHWTAHLRRTTSEDLVDAQTRNVSSEGLYCVSPVPFQPGELLECVIELPASGETREPRTLCCRATTVRLEQLNENLFGVALHIDDYSVGAPG